MQIYELTIAQLNNRQIALGIWAILLFLLVLFNKEVRVALGQLVRAALDSQLIVFWVSIGSSVTIVCLLLNRIGLWAFDQLMATMFWFLFTGTVTAAQALEAKEDEGYFKRLFWSALKVSGVFEFIVVANSFSLTAELVLTPILATLILMQAFTEFKEEYATVRKLVTALLIGVVIILFYISMAEITKDPDAFFTSQTGRNFILPAFLTIGCIPIFYFWFCYSHIETVRSVVRNLTLPSEDLKRYARRRFTITFLARPWLLRRALRQLQIRHVAERSHVDAIIYNILEYERRAENPPEVDAKKGWSPYLAREFLADYELRTGDYHLGVDNEYWASSPPIYLDQSIFPSSAILYIEGESGIVRQIKLAARLFDDSATEEAIETFRLLCNLLYDRAVGGGAPNFEKLFPNEAPFEFNLEIAETQIRAQSERYQNDSGQDIDFVLSR